MPCVAETLPDAAADCPGPSRLAPASRPGTRHVYMPLGFEEYEHHNGSETASKSHADKKQHKKSKKKKSTKSRKKKKKEKKKANVNIP